MLKFKKKTYKKRRIRTIWNRRKIYKVELKTVRADQGLSTYSSKSGRQETMGPRVSEAVWGREWPHLAKAKGMNRNWAQSKLEEGREFIGVSPAVPKSLDIMQWETLKGLRRIPWERDQCCLRIISMLLEWLQMCHPSNYINFYYII